ncbi:MAG: AraC family transcriptional regulator [Lachnospiraceae bacterium]|nr:AraC family transcriptional regulator [Lachnospiraceae bacterium]
MEHYSQIHFVGYENFKDIQVYEVGRQKCPPKHSYGPIVRGKFILHYVVDGQGRLCLRDQEYAISGGEIFVIYPEELAYYEADEKNPWRYLWVIFQGDKAEEILRQLGITETQPVFKSKESGTEILTCMETLLYEYGQELRTMGNMYALLQTMKNYFSMQKEHKTQPQQDYVQKIKRYIEYRYVEELKVSELAEHCGLNRSYMTKCFKEATGLSPKEYLLQYRMTKAKELLAGKDMPISNVAYAIGYSDPLAFSKMFRKREGMSPLEYRELAAVGGSVEKPVENE